MNKTVTPMRGLTIREQAEQSVKKELAEKALEKMKKLLRDRAAAQAVLAGIDVQIADLEKQIEDGTA